MYRSPIRRRMTDTDGSRETPHPSSVADGVGGQNPPSVIRSGWYRKMTKSTVSRTDRYGDPKTDRTSVGKCTTVRQKQASDFIYFCPSEDWWSPTPYTGAVLRYPKKIYWILYKVMVTFLKFILKNWYSRSRSSRSDNSHRPNAVGIIICDQYWTILDIWLVLAQTTVRTPVILLVVYVRPWDTWVKESRNVFFPHSPYRYVATQNRGRVADMVYSCPALSSKNEFFFLRSLIH
jgi:hypothetical protein